MPIKRTENPDGSWKEEATDKESARELFDKHGPALQKRGAEAFHNSWLKDTSIGFERVRDPAGNITHVRADRVDRSLAAEGYKPVANPSMIVPDVPWERKSLGGGRHKFKYNPATGLVEEIF